MIDALNAISVRSTGLDPRYPASRVLITAAGILLHPIVTLPVLVYLLGGDFGQIVIYAVISGVAAGLAGPTGTLVAKLPGTTRVVIVALLATQALGFLFATLVGLGVDALGDNTVLGLTAAAYLLLMVPTTLLVRIGEQGHEFRRSAAATIGGVVPAIVGVLLAGLMVWRLFENGGMGSDDLLARAVVGGALLAAAGSWLAHYPTILAAQLPHPARPMPEIRWPGLLSNRPLSRFVAFQAIQGIARFADPFLLVGVLVLISPGVAWIGGAVLAFAIGDALARLAATRAYGQVNVRAVFTVAGFLHALVYVIIAFAGDVLGSSIIADRNPAEAWRDWAAILAAAALGASYLFARTGHHAYIRSISSPGTRDLSLTAGGIVTIITAFAPLVAVQLLDGRDIATLLQIGAGASIISLLATALVVPTYAPPRRPRSAWGLRR